MMALFVTACAIALVGCGPPAPVTKATHIQQIQRTVTRVGVTNILNESRTLFTRLSLKTNLTMSVGDQMAGNPLFAGLSSLTNLGDVFTYASYDPDRIEIRVYNSHFDTYFITLVNPDLPEPMGFKWVAGNVGFIEPAGDGNGGQPIRSETNSTSSAAGSGR